MLGVAQEKSTERFEGRIAGFGTGVGTRVVVGMWERSPFGRFADAMVEFEGGHRLLLAPSEAVAEYVAGTYHFDEVRVVEVRFGRDARPVVGRDARPVTGRDAPPVAGRDARPVARRDAPRVAGRVRVSAGPLEARLAIGGPTALGRLLRGVPPRLAVQPGWLRVIDPVARVLVPGARTSGSAGGGRREFYGVTAARAILSVQATWEGESMGGLRRLSPPVTFGFGSAPATPTLVDIVTSIREPRSR